MAQREKQVDAKTSSEQGLKLAAWRQKQKSEYMILLQYCITQEI